jgi:putative YhbY family RNA-binding protein
VPSELTPAERQALKGRAHGLRPVVLIGADGLTPAVLAEIDRALKAHELIKIRVPAADRNARERLLAEVCAATAAAPVQHIGKILVLYRARPEEPAPAPLPARRPAPRRKPRRESRRPGPAGMPTPRRGKLRPR